MASLAPVTVAPAEPARGTAWRFLVPLCALVVLARATYVPKPLRNDEGGYLLSAREWHTGGEFMYGDYFVDRPPLLMLLFKVASLVGWDHAIRVLVIPFVLLFVLAGWRAGTVLAGPAGGRWAAVAAAGIMCSPGLGAEQADGELFGATLVMAALAAFLSAWDARSRRGLLCWAAAAGAIAVAAPLVKQSLVEGLLLLAGLVLLGCWGTGAVRRRALLVGAAGTLGALVPCALVAVWMLAAQIDPADAWYELVGSRGVALGELWATGPDDNLRRAAQLLVLGTVTGFLPAVGTWLLARRGGAPTAPGVRLIAPLLLFGIVGIASGGAYWPPYLLQLAPAVVLAVGARAPSASVPGAWMRGAGRTIAATAVLGTLGSAVVYAAVPSAWSTQRTGEWLAAAKAGDDTAVLVYGVPQVLETADVRPPYPHLWSAALRTLDPELSRLRATLTGPEAPEWVVQRNGFDAWGIDDGSRLRDLVHERYRVVAEVCGYSMWLRQDLTRELAPQPRC